MGKDGFIQSIENYSDDESLHSFLVLFRPFISEKEPIFINKIYNYCEVNIKDDVIRDYLRKSRQIWKQINDDHVGFRFIVNENHIKPKEIVDLWINGIFHVDKEKIIKIDKLNPVERFTHRAILLAYLKEATAQIIYVAI